MVDDFPAGSRLGGEQLFAAGDADEALSRSVEKVGATG